MNLATTIKFVTGDIQAESSGQMGPSDSRSSDEWIKNWLEQKALKANEIRQQLHRTIDPHLRELRSAVQEGKDVLDQDVGKIAGSGRYVVMSTDGLIVSRHDDRDEAADAAMGKRYAMVVDLGPEFEYRQKGPLGKRLPLNKVVDALRSRDLQRLGNETRYTTGGTGGVGTGSGL